GPHAHYIHPFVGDLSDDSADFCGSKVEADDQFLFLSHWDPFKSSLGAESLRENDANNVRSARLFCLPLGRFGDRKLSLQICLARIIEVDSGHKRGPIQLVQGIYYFPQLCNLLIESVLSDIHRNGPFAQNQRKPVLVPPAFAYRGPSEPAFRRIYGREQLPDRPQAALRNRVP